MDRQEATQLGVDGIGVLPGADLAFGQITEFPCEDCGGMVDLTTEISVTIHDMDGSETQERMTEANARELLRQVGIQPPPVLCDQHEPVEIITEPIR